MPSFLRSLKLEMQKPEREQGVMLNVECQALAKAPTSARDSEAVSTNAVGDRLKTAVQT